MNFDAKVIITALNNNTTVKTTIEGAKLTEVKLTHFNRADGCSECLKPFEEGESVIVIVPSVFKKCTDIDNNEEMALYLDAVYTVHLTNSTGNSCLEDFIARYIQNFAPKKDEVEKSNASPLPEPEVPLTI
jgi:hypothetical protein